MSKNINGNGAGAAPAAVHFVLQGKGGVGKSVVASWLAEFLTSHGQKVCAIDADPINRSLGQYKGLKPELLDLVNADGLVERNRFDTLVDRFATADGAFIVDAGATAFLPLWTYILETELMRVLRETGRTVYVHIPISGGEMLNDTLLGFKTLADSATERSLVVWLNEYFGPISREGKDFNQMQVYLDNRDKVLAVVGIPQRSTDTYGETVRRMRERKMTFGEALQSPEFMLAQRSRLHIVRRDLFEQLERTPLVVAHNA
jgi:CobQ/CobB/MinD/ParA nucleotide binding domain